MKNLTNKEIISRLLGSYKSSQKSFELVEPENWTKIFYLIRTGKITLKRNDVKKIYDDLFSSNEFNYFSKNLFSILAQNWNLLKKEEKLELLKRAKYEKLRSMDFLAIKNDFINIFNTMSSRENVKKRVLFLSTFEEQYWWYFLTENGFNDKNSNLEDPAIIKCNQIVNKICSLDFIISPEKLDLLYKKAERALRN